MDILKDRFELSLKYGLVRTTQDGWEFTQKCIDNYDMNTYLRYLKGNLEKPLRITGKPVKKMTIQEELKSPEYQKLLDEIFNL